MPKIKTNKSAAKRFKKTKSGEYKRHKAFGRHLLAHKSSKRKRALGRAATVDPSEKERIKRLLPYSA